MFLQQFLNYNFHVILNNCTWILCSKFSVQTGPNLFVSEIGKWKLESKKLARFVTDGDKMGYFLIFQLGKTWNYQIKKWHLFLSEIGKFSAKKKKWNWKVESKKLARFVANSDKMGYFLIFKFGKMLNYHISKFQWHFSTQCGIFGRYHLCHPSMFNPATSQLRNLSIK